MAKEYKVGMVAELLGGGKPSEGKLASLFSSPSPTVTTKQNTPKAKKKLKVKDTTPSKTKGKSPKKRKSKSHDSDEEDISDTKAKRVSKPSSGYEPPPGIVHEALLDADKNSTNKRNRGSNEEDEDGSKRPRRDRLKKGNEMRTVFVGNVPLTVGKKGLTKLFREFGAIENVRFRCAPVADPGTKKRVAVITKEFHEQRHNISAYVCFKEEDSAKKAISLNGRLVDGLHIRVDSAKQTKTDSKRSIFVGNLSFAIEEESLRDHFEVCGVIENVRVIRDRKTNLGKGFCYILFESKDSVSLALKLHKSTLEGRELRVQPCTDQSILDKKKKKEKKTSADKTGRATRTVKTGQTARTSKSGTTAKTTTAKSTTPAASNVSAKKHPKMRNKMWRPTNASNSQVLLAAVTALKRKRRQSDKKKKQRSQVDAITRVLGPVQQPEARGKPAGKKTKAFKEKGLKGSKQKGLKGSKAKKGKKVGRG